MKKEVGEHLDNKPATEPAKPGEPAVDMKKVDAACGRLRQALDWLWGKGIVPIGKVSIEVFG